MEADSALQLLLSVNQLKRVPRTGWLMRGVASAESVSDHTFGVAFVALVLAHMLEQSVDVAKVLTIALLHDLPEGILGDIPAPASRHFPPAAKHAAEEQILRSLFDGFLGADEWREWWQEFEEQASVEARLVRDADRIDLLIQAFVYEETTGNCWLEEFWEETTADSFRLTASRALFEALSRFRGPRGRHGGVR